MNQRATTARIAVIAPRGHVALAISALATVEKLAASFGEAWRGERPASYGEARIDLARASLDAATGAGGLIAGLYDVLTAVEWRGRRLLRRGHSVACCPLCEGVDPTAPELDKFLYDRVLTLGRVGHQSGCRLAAILGGDDD
jgi:hypothetical protein